MDDSKISMQPSSNIYSYFKNFKYQPWTAIAEFIDNSTQSYFDNKEKIKQLPNFDKLIVEIETNLTDRIRITDNAFGMELEDFKRAVRVDKPKNKINSRHEFGMGLKTAACWFGNQWEVRSTQLGSTNVYSTIVNVDDISNTEEGSAYVDVKKGQAKVDDHYTEIIITKLNKPIKSKKIQDKIKNLIASIYREDIRNGEINFIFNESKLSFEEVEIYSEIDENGQKKEFKEQLDFTILHEGTDLTVKGFVAIRKVGNVNESGITLLRRGRVIIGGLESNYKPKELLGAQNSFTYQRIFGELHLDNWSVTQAKDDFDWHNSDLEEKFISKLNSLIYNLKRKSETIRVRQSVNTIETTKQAIKSLEDNNIIDKDSSSIISSEEKFIEEERIVGGNIAVDKAKEHPSVIFVGPKSNTVELKRKGVSYKLTINMEDSIGKWLSIYNSENNSDDYSITLNIMKKFFSPINTKPDLISFITQFVIIFAIAEIECNKASKISPGEIRNKMNELLSEDLSGDFIWEEKL